MTFTNRSTYAGQFGSYLPVIHGLGGNLSYVAIQCYNSGSQYGRDGGIYTQGTQDFCVAMADLLLGGYTLANGQLFPALTPSQVAFGVPGYRGGGSAGRRLLPAGHGLTGSEIHWLTHILPG